MSKFKINYKSDPIKIRRLLEITNFDHMIYGNKTIVNIGGRGTAKTTSACIIGADRWLNPESKDSIAIGKLYIKDNVDKTTNSFKQAIELVSAEIDFLFDKNGKAINFTIKKPGFHFEDIGYAISELQSPKFFLKTNPNKIVNFFGLTRIDAVKGSTPMDGMYNVVIVDEFLPDKAQAKDLLVANQQLSDIFWDFRMTFWRPPLTWSDDFIDQYSKDFPPLAIYNTNPAELMSIGVLYENFFEPVGHEAITYDRADILIKQKYLVSNYGDEKFKGGLSISHTTYMSNNKYPKILFGELEQIKRTNYQKWLKIALGLEPQDLNSPFVASYSKLKKIRNSYLYKEFENLEHKNFYYDGSDKTDLNKGPFWENFKKNYVEVSFGFDISFSRDFNALIGAAITSDDYSKNEMHLFSHLDIDPKKTIGELDDDERIYKKVLEKIRDFIKKSGWTDEIILWVDSANLSSIRRMKVLLNVMNKKDMGFDDLTYQVKIRHTNFKQVWNNVQRTNDWNSVLPLNWIYVCEIKESRNNYILFGALKTQLATNRLTKEGKVKEGIPDDFKQATEYVMYRYLVKKLRQ